MSKSFCVSEFGKVELTSTPAESSFYKALALLKLSAWLHYHIYSEFRHTYIDINFEGGLPKNILEKNTVLWKKGVEMVLTDFTPPPPFEAKVVWKLKLVFDLNLFTETSNLRILKVMPRHLNRNCVHSWIRLRYSLFVAYMCWSVQYILYCTPCLTSYHLSSPKIFHYGHSSHSCKPLPFRVCFQLGFPISSQKIFRGRRNTTERITVSSKFRLFRETKTYGIPLWVIPRNRKDTGIFLRIIPRLEYLRKDKFREKNLNIVLSFRRDVLFRVFCFVSFRFVVQNRPFRTTQNSACFAKQKTYGIPFRVIPRNRKYSIPEFCYESFRGLNIFRKDEFLNFVYIVLLFRRDVLSPVISFGFVPFCTTK